MASKRGMVYHNLATMLEAGMPILKSLEQAGIGWGKLSRALKSVSVDAAAGEGLVESMKKHPRAFGALDLLLIDAGEQSGDMVHVFKFLAGWYDFCTRLQRIIIAGLVLPAFILHIAAFLNPAAPMILGKISLTAYFLEAAKILAFFYIPLVAILCIVLFTPRSGILRWMLDTFTLYTPVLGKAVRNLALSRYCQAFSIMYKAGVPIVQCARNATGVTGNVVIARMLEGGYISAKTGHPMSAGFSRSLPESFRSIWETGEETGKLDEASERLAKASADTSEFLFEQLAQWLPRIMYFGVMILMVKMIFEGYSSIGYGLGELK
jgi:type IV pilus assembly protein PilC